MAQVTQKHWAWALDSIRGYCNWRMYGVSPRVITQQMPQEEWKPEYGIPEPEPEQVVPDLHYKDYLEVQQQSNVWVRLNPDSARILELLFHVHGKGLSIERFTVVLPFQRVPTTLGQMGSNAIGCAMQALKDFERHYAQFKADQEEKQLEEGAA